jgi:hypothetical protein
MAKVQPYKIAKVPSELKVKRKLLKREQARIFLASPSDVKTYRKVTRSVVDTLNSTSLRRAGKLPPLFLYTWEDCKSPGYTEDYQKDIFQEFGTWCDVFILLLWHRIGEGGTEQEYEAFIKIFRKNNPNILLCVALIREPVDPYKIDPDQLRRLRDFSKRHQDNWAVLGNERDAIKSTDDYQRELTSVLMDFIHYRLIL